MDEKQGYLRTSETLLKNGVRFLQQETSLLQMTGDLGKIAQSAAKFSKLEFEILA